MDVGLRRGERKRRGPKPKPITLGMSKYRRKEANARERQRQGEINKGFELLREKVPHPVLSKGKCEKLRKIDVLHVAISYIRALENILESGEPGINDFANSLYSVVPHNIFTQTDTQTRQTIPHTNSDQDNMKSIPGYKTKISNISNKRKLQDQGIQEHKIKERRGFRDKKMGQDQTSKQTRFTGLRSKPILLGERTDNPGERRFDETLEPGDTLHQYFSDISFSSSDSDIFSDTSLLDSVSGSIPTLESMISSLSSSVSDQCGNLEVRSILIQPSSSSSSSSSDSSSTLETYRSQYTQEYNEYRDNSFDSGISGLGSDIEVVHSMEYTDDSKFGIIDTFSDPTLAVF